ncbi:MAG: DNA polymerase/3'-5' exonuclease PolX [Planctomycetota bacterium]
MDKRELVGILDEMADLMEVESDNPFRSRSFRSASRALDAYPGDLGAGVRSGEVQSLKGIGAKIASVIEEIAETGASERHRELLETVPEGVRAMLGIPGLGPKKVRALWKKAEIETIPALVAACEEGRVASLSGFGAKSQEKIIEGIEYLESVAGRYLFPEAEALSLAIVEHLKDCPAVQGVEAAGSLRRRKELIGDLDFLVSSDDPGVVSDHFLKFEAVASVVVHGSTKTSVRLETGIAADLRVVNETQFPFALAYFTGSKEHNTQMRQRAKDRGLRLNEYGLHGPEEGDSVDCDSESAIYEALDLHYVEPELREGFGEIQLSESNDLPVLLEESQIRGVLHAHSTWSDGRASIQDMAEACRAAGYSYLGITDHSKTAAYAGGLTIERVEKQHAEIDELNAGWDDFRIFKGIESDILPNGDLDYPEEVLAQFDFIVASLHSSLTQPVQEMTDRVVRALENPHTTMLGHATARVLLRREEVALDMDRVLERAAELGVVVEINANPHRLDLDWRHGPRARELGVLTSINPDAHSVAGIRDIRYGVGIARKAGFAAGQVVNTFDIETFAKFIQRRK